MKVPNAYSIYFLAFSISACSGDYDFALAGDYVVYSEAKTMQWIWPRRGVAPGEKFVPCNVERVCYDQEFIVADQVNNQACNSTNSQSFLLENESIAAKYKWIIIVKTSVVIGPLSLDQYDLDARKYNIGGTMRCVDF